MFRIVLSCAIVPPEMFGDPTIDVTESSDKWLSVRPLSLKELDEVEAFVELTGECKWGRQDFAYFFSHPSNFSFSLRASNEDLAGLVITQASGGALDMILVMVHPKYRQIGLASTLVRHLQAAESVHSITLEVSTGNLPAIGLYRKCGFRVCSVRRKYYEGKRDAYLMRWDTSLTGTRD